MIAIHLYGKLRKYAPDRSPAGDSVLWLKYQQGETMEELLMRAGLPLEDIYTIFLNAKLLSTHNRMAHWLEYPQVGESCHEWDLSIPIKDGDRIGLFGKDMPALVV